jgi:hypothetical protein
MFDRINYDVQETRRVARGEGIAEGRAESKILAAFNLREIGIATDTISTATGLSPEEISSLRKVDMPDEKVTIYETKVRDVFDLLLQYEVQEVRRVARSKGKVVGRTEGKVDVANKLMELCIATDIIVSAIGISSDELCLCMEVTVLDDESKKITETIYERKVYTRYYRIGRFDIQETRRVARGEGVDKSAKAIIALGRGKSVEDVAGELEMPISDVQKIKDSLTTVLAS